MRYCKAIIITVAILMLALPCLARCTGANDSIIIKDKYRLLPLINPCIKVGIGGAKNYFVVPNLALKMGHITLEANVLVANDYYREALQLNVELFQFNRKNVGFADFICVSGGYLYQEHKNSNDIENFILMVGVNRYVIDKRLQLTANIGINNKLVWYENPWRTVETNKTYGELSVSFSMFKHTFKPFQPWSKSKKQFYVAKYFNPYLSLGLGVDRAVIFPAFGLKVGALNTQLSIGGVDNLMFSFAVGTDLKRTKENEKFVIKPSLDLNAFFADGLGFLTGVMFGRKRYKKDGHACFYSKVGLALLTNDYDGSLDGILPILGFGVNFHTFKFQRGMFIKDLGDGSM